MAALGATPLWRRLDGPPWQPPARRFTGDDFEEAHRLLARPQEIIAAHRVDLDPARRDLVIIGGGIAGLTVAYRLRDLNVLLLERASDTGGVAKSETWQGLEYALGAAYMIDPDPESEDPRERENAALLQELGLRQKGEDLQVDRNRGRRLAGEANHCVFSNTRTLPGAEVYTPRNVGFFEHVLEHENYPAVPPENETLVQQLDTVSFQQFLQNAALQRKIYGRSVGLLSARGWEAIEYYCWGAFGTTAAETSAYHGLNFFAAEFADLLVFAGGNAAVAKRLTEHLVRQHAGSVRTGWWGLRAEPAREGGGYDVLAYHDGAVDRLRARAVVVATPLFLATRIVPGLPDAQRRAIDSLDYRSYVVANVLLTRRIDRIFANPRLRNGYELTRVHLVDVRKQRADRLSGRKVFSDAVVADFPVWRHQDGGVLTVYRPYPYPAGRADLMALSYEQIETEVRDQVLEAFSAHGLRKTDIEEIRITRWGHPMIVARPGQLADGTMKAARQGLPGLFFAHTDVQGAPAIENAFASAADAVEAVRRHLA